MHVPAGTADMTASLIMTTHGCIMTGFLSCGFFKETPPSNDIHDVWSLSSTLHTSQQRLQAQTDLFTILEGHAGRNWVQCPSIFCYPFLFSPSRLTSAAAAAGEAEEADLEAPLLPPSPPPSPPSAPDASTSDLPPLHSVPPPLRPSSPPIYPPLFRPLRPSVRLTWTWLDWARFLAIKHALDALLVGCGGEFAVGCVQGG